jgi:hypothetical protein
MIINERNILFKGKLKNLFHLNIKNISTTVQETLSFQSPGLIDILKIKQLFVLFFYVISC